MSKKPLILGIESSCDETAASIISENEQGNPDSGIGRYVTPPNGNWDDPYSPTVNNAEDLINYWTSATNAASAYTFIKGGDFSVFYQSVEDLINDSNYETFGFYSGKRYNAEIENPAIFSYDATGTTFVGPSGNESSSDQSNAIAIPSSQFDVHTSGITVNASRTFIVTFNTSFTTDTSRIQTILGYGGWGSNTGFYVALSNNTSHGGTPSTGKSVVFVSTRGNDAYISDPVPETLIIDANVETTIAVSYDNSTGNVYIFVSKHIRI